VIEAPCVLGEVGTVFDNRQFSKLVIRRPLAAETRVLSHTPLCVRFLVNKMTMREVSGVFCFFYCQYYSTIAVQSSSFQHSSYYK
jgi:hypothetical protein